MKDLADQKTIDLLGEPKRRGRPPAGPRSRTAAERKRDHRARQKTAVMAPESEGGKYSENWTFQECLAVLSDPNLRSSYGFDAHKRIGVLLGIK